MIASCTLNERHSALKKRKKEMVSGYNTPLSIRLRFLLPQNPMSVEGLWSPSHLFSFLSVKVYLKACVYGVLASSLRSYLRTKAKQGNAEHTQVTH
jgi:hypothetical protein